MNDCNAQTASTPVGVLCRGNGNSSRWVRCQHGVLTWGSTPFESIADAQAMDRQYDGSWGTDLVGYGRLAAVAKDGQG